MAGFKGKKAVHLPGSEIRRAQDRAVKENTTPNSGKDFKHQHCAEGGCCPADTKDESYGRHGGK